MQDSSTKEWEVRIIESRMGSGTGRLDGLRSPRRRQLFLR